jgi:hypothetical protein
MEEMNRSLGRLEAKVDLLLEDRGRLVAVTDRVDKVEKDVHTAKSTAGIVAGVVALVATVFGGYFNRG